MHLSIVLILILGLSGCNEESTQEQSKQHKNDCRGIWAISDSFGVSKKFNESWSEALGACAVEQIALTEWEKSSRTRLLKQIKCEPQNEIPSVSLQAANNYYSYRNGRILIQLNSENGTYKKLEIGESLTGATEYAQEEGCFFTRQDNENEPWGAVDYGLQILLDAEEAAGTNPFRPMQVFRLNVSGDDWFLTRFDQISDWNYRFCPEGNTPWGYCDLLRNGNSMYHPDGLLESQKDDLRNEAILIRTEFNFKVISPSDFEASYSSSIRDLPEMKDIWRYVVLGIPDIPTYTNRAWREYLRNERPIMPEAQPTLIDTICYRGTKEITYPDLSTGFIGGIACYVDGEYFFYAD